MMMKSQTEVQKPVESKEKSVHHFDFGIPMKYIQQPESNSLGVVTFRSRYRSQPAVTSERPVTVTRQPPVVMPKLTMSPKVNQLTAAAGPRPQPVSATEPQPSTSSIAGTSSLGKAEILGKNGGESAQLEAEKAVVLQEKDKLKAVLETVKVQIEMGKALLYKVLEEKEKIHTAGSLKIQQLEAAVNNEKQQRTQMEKLLAEQLVETKRLQEELAQGKKKMEEEKLQREEDMSRLLAEHSKTASLMKAAAVKAQEDLENERSQWLQEKSSIQAALNSLKESTDKTVEEKDKFTADKTSQVCHLELNQKEAQKKPKKRSLKKRFIQLFKRS